MYTIAVDIGGTFTDVVAIDGASGHAAIGKVPTTPDDLLEGVLTGLADAAAAVGLDRRTLLERATRFVHATTQSTNAVLARTGAKTAVLTTRGFGDTLMIMRSTGRVAGLSVLERHHYRKTDKPKPLANERDIFEIIERVDYAGRVVTPLDEAGVRQTAKTLRARGYEAVAVAYLFSHRNPGHERRTAEILREELPDCYVSLSSRVAPLIGEYERSATALFDAYVGKVMHAYLDRLERQLADAGLDHPPLIVQANGGVATIAQTVPVMTIESGPAAGVVGAADLARTLGIGDVIATDVGGTTFKVALISGGAWSYARETVVSQYQLRLPMVDIASIGAGGGSIAWVDGSRLRVGPQSAGADPGPACYGFGGTAPTVTDADLVLGYLSPERFLDGRMRLDPKLAVESIRDHVAEPLFGGDIIAAAAGIRNVVDSQMADLIRKATLERGHDPRGFVMMAYGGAGPTHAAAYGVQVGVREVLVPRFATVHSARGAAASDIRFSLRTSEPMVLPGDAERVERIYARMAAEGTALLTEAGVPAAGRRLERWVEARYRRQVHTVRVSAEEKIDAASLDRLALAFGLEYARLFGAGAALADAGVELIHYGVEAIGSAEQPPTQPYAPARADAAPRTRRPTYCPHRRAMVDTPIFDGPSLPADAVLAGPAIIEQPGTTIVVHAGQRARLDDGGHIRIALQPKEGAGD